MIHVNLLIGELHFLLNGVKSYFNLGGLDLTKLGKNFWWIFNTDTFWKIYCLSWNLKDALDNQCFQQGGGGAAKKYLFLYQYIIIVFNQHKRIPSSSTDKTFDKQIKNCVLQRAKRSEAKLCNKYL
jgi:hypothetical protein